jgi:hypothetical protein
MTPVTFLIRWIEIQWLKFRARRLIARLDAMIDGSDLNRAWLRDIYPSYKRMDDELESIVQRCIQIDPTAKEKIQPRQWPHT